jgi:hypothetical protein
MVASSARRGDNEGHLVLGFLLRHGLTVDPDDIGAVGRFKLAETTWQLPLLRIPGQVNKDSGGCE